MGKNEKKSKKDPLRDVPNSVMTNDHTGVLKTPDACKAQRDAYRELFSKEDGEDF